ncbi:MAG TPA: hypothetical protein DD658_02315 [Deltaproteobacteria bacterium]|nr:hypothetical protein [Deltaproteobacteria bacterium]
MTRSKAGLTYSIVPSASVTTIASADCDTAMARRTFASSARTRSVMSCPWAIVAITVVPSAAYSVAEFQRAIRTDPST